MGNQQPHNSTIVELIVGPFHACSNSAEIDVTLTHKQEPGGWKGVDGDGGLLRGICVAVDWVRDRGEFVGPATRYHRPRGFLGSNERGEGREGWYLYYTPRYLSCKAEKFNISRFRPRYFYRCDSS